MSDPGFWAELPRPILALAPMAGVTDAAYRRMFARHGKPHVMFTEFVACAGLDSPGRENLLRDLWYHESERPICAQLWGSDPSTFAPAAELVAELGFDGIDLNTGCPDRNVEKCGGGAALIRTPERLPALVTELRRGAPHLPISIKTRLGYSHNELDTWLPRLLDTDPAAVIVHLRTRQEMSDVPAHWELAADAVAIRDRLGHPAPILGNGDVANLAEAHERVAGSGLDGVMVGRGVFGDPWFFNPAVDRAAMRPDEMLAGLLEHVDLYGELFGAEKSFEVMKKHFKAYCQGFPGAKELRIRLMETHTAADVHRVVASYTGEG